MAQIYIIDSIRLNRKGLQTQDANNTWVALHCQQGRLDGACVVYSTIMALLSIGYLNEEDIDIWKKKNPDMRTLKGKLISHLLDEQGLVRDGYYLMDMTKELKNALRDYTVEHYAMPNCIGTALEYLAAGYPVIFQVSNDTFSHAILAIGIEYEGDLSEDIDAKLMKFLCLDPGFDKPMCSYWNCVIDVSRKNAGDYPYWYITDSQHTQKIEISEIITIEEL